MTQISGTKQADGRVWEKARWVPKQRREWGYVLDARVVNGKGKQRIRKGVRQG